MKLKVFLLVMFCLGLFITSCKNPVSDSNVTNNNNANPNANTKVEKNLVSTTQPLTFNLSNANAVATVSPMDTLSRAATEPVTSPLAKVLNDSTIVDALSLPKGATLSKIKQMITVESNGKKYLYIIFESESNYSYEEVRTYEKKTTIEYEPDEKGNVLPPEVKIETIVEKEYKSGSLGSFLCVAEDGTYDDILKIEDSKFYRLTNEQKMVTDNNGVIYFTTTNDEGASCIRRYYPTEKRLEAVTANIKGTSFNKIQISEDGKMLFISGSRNNNNKTEYFLRYIPVNSPANFINIVYTTNGGWLNWIYQDFTDTLYYMAEKFAKDGTSTLELFRVNNLNKLKTKDDVLKNTVMLSKDGYLAENRMYWVGCYINGIMYDNNTGILLKADQTKDPLLRLYYKDDKCIVEPISGYNPINVVKSGNNFVFNNSIIDANNQETGFQNLVLLDTSNFTFTNLFKNTPDNLNIISYSVSKDKVYFSAETGISVISGCIDIPTLEYSPLLTNQVVNLIEAY